MLIPYDHGEEDSEDVSDDTVLVYLSWTKNHIEHRANVYGCIVRIYRHVYFLFSCQWQEARLTSTGLIIEKMVSLQLLDNSGSEFMLT